MDHSDTGGDTGGDTGEAVAMPDARRPRVLIVDDERAIVEALRDTLQSQGYETEGFTDGHAALAGLRKGDFELLLADLGMPGIGGVDLLREAQARDPDLVGVIMTGEGTIATAVEAMKTGALDYVLKPLKLSVILPVLSRALTVRRLRIDNVELEMRVRERTAELETALREVEEQTAERLRAEQALMQAQKLEAIGRLTGGIAHDFNNLLQAIDGGLYLLSKRLEPDHAGWKYVEIAKQATARGVKVTSQLLSFSRTQRLDLKPTDVAGALREAGELFAHAVGPDIRFRSDVAAEAVWAIADRAQLELAIINLAINARDAMADGGAAVLSISRDHLDDGTPCIAIALADGGAGMTPEVRARATEPFFTTKPRGKGIGLGLAQVYGFAHQCGGAVAIESVVGAGTTVRILLPQASPGMDAATSSPASVAPTVQKHAQELKVLVVDDDDSVRQVLADGLRAQGFKVSEAADGAGGLAVFERERPDVLVLDFAMPGMTGAEVARRAQAVRPDVPVVFCSGYSDTLALDGVAHSLVLRKPVGADELARSVHSAMTAP
ncbi:MAG TPA: response regulator [Caulobacteraceae bacterium]